MRAACPLTALAPPPVLRLQAASRLRSTLVEPMSPGWDVEAAAGAGSVSLAGGVTAAFEAGAAVEAGASVFGGTADSAG